MGHITYAQASSVRLVLIVPHSFFNRFSTMFRLCLCVLVGQVLGMAYAFTSKNYHMEGTVVFSDVDPGCRVDNVFGGCSECWADATRHMLTCLSDITNLPYTADCNNFLNMDGNSTNNVSHSSQYVLSV